VVHSEEFTFQYDHIGQFKTQSERLAEEVLLELSENTVRASLGRRSFLLLDSPYFQGRRLGVWSPGKEGNSCMNYTSVRNSLVMRIELLRKIRSRLDNFKDIQKAMMMRSLHF